MPTTHFFYILTCSDGSFYIGSTANINNRVKIHNQGKGATYTAKRRPVHLVYYEAFGTLDDAVKKGAPGKKMVKSKKRSINTWRNGKFKKIKQKSVNNSLPPQSPPVASYIQIQPLGLNHLSHL